MHISLRWTLNAGPRGVHLRESWQYTQRQWKNWTKEKSVGLPGGLSLKVKLRVDVPRPPELVSSTTGPEPAQGFVDTTSFAGLWYSRVEYKSHPQILTETMSSFDLPRLHPRTVILVPPEAGPDLGDSPVISGVLLDERTWPRVGARRGLKRGKGWSVLELVEGEVTGDCNSTAEYKFSIDLEPFLEIEAASIEDLLFERSLELFPLLRSEGNKLFHLPLSPPDEEGFLKERTQQSIHRSPIACEFFVVNGNHRRRWATEGICASGKLAVPSVSSLSVTVKISGAGFATVLERKNKKRNLFGGFSAFWKSYAWLVA